MLHNSMQDKFVAFNLPCCSASAAEKFLHASLPPSLSSRCLPHQETQPAVKVGVTLDDAHNKGCHWQNTYHQAVAEHCAWHKEAGLGL
jgi:hypothetical protein